MKKILIALFIVLITISVQAQEKIASDISTYYLIRHAEKIITEDKNPDLDSLGELRAKQWADIFKDISFDAVYSTDYKRTRNTALPTADSKDLNLILYHPTNITYKDFMSETKGKTVLIVGHSNTIPNFVNELIGKEKYELIEHDNFGNLYIIEIAESVVTDKLLYLK